MIAIRGQRDGHCWAVGRTHFDPNDHVLCEGTLDEVLTILVSIYGWTPRSPQGIRGILRSALL